MGWRKKGKHLLFTGFSVFLTFAGISQNETEYPYASDELKDPAPVELNQEKLPPPELDREAWKSLSKDLDFGEKQEEEPEEEEPIDTSSSWDWNIDTSLLGSIILGVVILLLVAILIWLIAKQLDRRDARLRPQRTREFTLEELEEDLPRSELETFLAAALSSGDYRKAIRVYYLMAIQALHRKGMIEWQREKTNYQYLFELRNTEAHSTFSELTLGFEIVWYGNTQVEKSYFDKVQPGYKRFIDKFGQE